jgi:hypothetical protein
MKSSTPTSVEETLCQMREVRVAAVVADEETENKTLFLAAIIHTPAEDGVLAIGRPWQKLESS